ncbi:PD-(D/E)XK nuclease family protein [Microbulbifer rhizosphaerae]|uniref:Putative DNA repair protein n=1 Tax=Microbulbifer rhizosphaerae TaxID=1562603 RepID=A0A7W4Z7X4_9GAMM|nr:PD-(D/E)XK nuclease family protein [Microbulbifer rhizosphaerae]MBB3059951.1 putative DNA repair protein [Microbulbifer rhizosphaerae]
MLQPAFPLLEILAQLPPGGLLLTPTNRLRNRCQQVYGAQQAAGSCWAPPPVESLQGWLEKCWFRLQQRNWQLALRQVLNREQRQLLWQRALDQSLDRQLLNSQQLCRDADSALSQLMQWRLLSDFDTLDDTLPPLLEQFALARGDFPLFDMIDAFQAQLRSHNAITQDQRDQLIARAFREGVLLRVPQLALAGFAQISPLAEEIVTLAAEQVTRCDSPEAKPQITCAPCVDLEDELLQAARWAADKLRQNPGAGLGIVVNNLGQCRAQVENIFARVLEPQWLNPDQPRYTLPFNFSAGTPLAQTPVGAAAMQLLELLRDQWDYAQLKNILFSPFWGTTDELHLRSALFRQLQKLELWQIDGVTLRYRAEKIAGELSPESPLPKQLEKVADFARRWQRAPAEIWAQRFSQTLETLGWPGPRNPDSQEYQQLTQWEGALEELAALSTFAGALTLNQALQQLNQIANRTPFQAETRDSPVQILGVLEAGGLAFDHLRLVGFGQQQWPPPPSPNPLLPMPWQKHWQMPRASAERELELARQITRDLLGAAADITVSFAREEDGVQQQLSSLFGQLPQAATVNGDSLESFYHQLESAAALEKIEDAQLPPLPAEERVRVRGGASVLKAQALCPLNAQLQYRLGAASYQAPALGLSAAERGNLVHQVLAHFWLSFPEGRADAFSLHQLQGEERQLRIREAVENAIREKQAQHRQLPAGFWQLEQQRLTRLLEQWLEVEETRPDFSVTRIEWEQPIELAGLGFHLRLDRLDQLPNGEQLVIDYKTGVPSINDWLSERVREPQLPLYALMQTEARAIAFAQVRNGDSKFKGCGDIAEPIEGIKAVADTQKESPFDNWEQLVDHWRLGLSQLAEEYREGYAALAFQRPADNFAQRDLWPLNRWPERVRTAE